MADEFYQRQPLLSTEDGIETHSLDHFSPRARNGSAVKIEIPETERDCNFPKERWKTLLAVLFVILAFLATTTSLSITHELRPAKSNPLPDLLLDNIPYYSWALDVSEILIMVITTICAVVVICHKHRWILARRVCLIIGLLYFYRAITMIVTALPSANKQYKCDPQLNHTITAGEVVRRVVKIMSGFGLSINGQHVYCGDFIFSGHTMILILSYLIISEYTPAKLWLIHWTSLLMGVGGVVSLMCARGHYSVDVILAYFITTRLWFMMHSVILNLQLQQHHTTNHMSRVWWWRILVFFEKNIKHPLPNEFEIPRPWLMCWQQVALKPRIRDPGRDI
jgi:shingomyelin synthase